MHYTEYVVGRVRREEGPNEPDQAIRQHLERRHIGKLLVEDNGKTPERKASTRRCGTERRFADRRPRRWFLFQGHSFRPSGIAESDSARILYHGGSGDAAAAFKCGGTSHSARRQALSARQPEGRRKRA